MQQNTGLPNQVRPRDRFPFPPPPRSIGFFRKERKKKKKLGPIRMRRQDKVKKWSARSRKPGEAVAPALAAHWNANRG